MTISLFVVRVSRMSRRKRTLDHMFDEEHAEFNSDSDYHTQKRSSHMLQQTEPSSPSSPVFKKSQQGIREVNREPSNCMHSSLMVSGDLTVHTDTQVRCKKNQPN